NRTPNNPLSAFDTQSIAGNWRLECSDQAGQDTGSVQEWCLLATGVVDSLLFADDFEFGSSGRWSAVGN
ncbi:MAG: proprotein convertase P-domain-containing protein, partial [Thermoanaerobaculia bacterium]|nr:proprotein convertase P-domain-containing protein [Thermoanaerobaculia bacterium]